MVLATVRVEGKRIELIKLPKPHYMKLMDKRLGKTAGAGSLGCLHARSALLVLPGIMFRFIQSYGAEYGVL